MDFGVVAWVERGDLPSRIIRAFCWAAAPRGAALVTRHIKSG